MEFLLCIVSAVANAPALFYLTSFCKGSMATGDFKKDESEVADIQFFALDDLPAAISPPDQAVVDFYVNWSVSE